MIGRIAFVGTDERLRLFFSLVGVECFSSVSEVDESVFAVALVEESLFERVDLRKYFGRLLLIPFRRARRSLSDSWFNHLVRGEVFK